MKAAVDVQYDDSAQVGRAAAVVFEQWSDETPLTVRVREHQGLEPYVSGQFFRRELPCLLPLLQELRREVVLDVIVVDGHVDLGPGHPGLGRHLFQSLRLGADLPALEIVGVAKSPFVGALSLPVCRGRSARPLWVSSTASAEAAARDVLAMHGPDRLPTLLRLVDHLARGFVEP